jgi:transposase InsO family protein
MSPQSNGMSEAFVNTIKADYIAGANRSTAAAIIEQIPSWIEDYNTVAPLSALGFKSRLEYRSEQQSEQKLAQQS